MAGKEIMYMTKDAVRLLHLDQIKILMMNFVLTCRPHCILHEECKFFGSLLTHVASHYLF